MVNHLRVFHQRIRRKTKIGNSDENPDVGATNIGMIATSIIVGVLAFALGLIVLAALTPTVADASFDFSNNTTNSDWGSSSGNTIAGALGGVFPIFAVLGIFIVAIGIAVVKIKGQ